jgi:hypothetical protein
MATPPTGRGFAVINSTGAIPLMSVCAEGWTIPPVVVK